MKFPAKKESSQYYRVEIETGPDRTAVMGFFAVILIAVAVYINKFANGFVWDDHLFILGGEARRGLGFADVLGYFSEPVANLYRPLRSLLYAVVWNMGGSEPFAYHMVGVTLHALACGAFFLICLRLAMTKEWAFFAAVLFAVHPLKTGRVTNMTGGFDLLAIVFYLYALVLFLDFLNSDEKPFGKLWASFALFVAALFSGEEAFTFPLTAFFAAWFAPNKQKAKGFYAAIAGFLILVAFILLRTTMIASVSRGGPSIHPAPGLAFSTFLSYFPLYLRLFIFPVKQSYLYDDLPLAHTFWNPSTLLGAGLAVGFAALIYLVRKKDAALSFGLAFGGIAMAPFSNIVPVATLFAERYFYLPSAGFTIAAVAIISRLDSNKKVLRVVLVVLVAVLSFLTLARNANWRTDQTMFEESVRNRPTSLIARHNLGEIYLGKGYALFLQKDPSAKDWFQKAIDVSESSKAHIGMGHVLLEEGNTPGARAHYERALEIEPNYAKAIYPIAKLMIAQREYAKARKLLLRLYPKNAKDDLAWLLLGQSCQALAQNDEECIAEFQVKLDSRLWVGRGVYLTESGKNEEAVKWFEEFLKDSPNSSIAPAVKQRISQIEQSVN